MADLGAVAKDGTALGGMAGLFLGCIIRTNPAYAGSGLGDMSTATGGRIQGVVTENSVPIKDCIVLLYYRPSGVLIGRKRTDADGYYEFNGLIPTPNLYSVVVQDLAGGTQYNDQIKSLTTPG